MKKTLVMYHKACNDGIASAWSAYAQFGEDAEYLPWQYGDKIPFMANRDVFMVDLSLTTKVLKEIAWSDDAPNFIMIIDHHKSAIEGLEYDFPAIRNYEDLVYHAPRSDQGQVFVYLDIEQAGAMLTWKFFQNWDKTPEAERAKPPEILRYIQDYDLWKHEIKNAKAINAWLSNGDLTIERFDSITGFDGKVRYEFIQTGKALMQYDDKIIRHTCRDYIQMVQCGKFQVPFVNAPHHLRNEIGSRLGEEHPFVVLYTERNGKTIYSLRSKEMPIDWIATQNGGGGHANAAAFKMTHTRLELYKHSLIFGTPKFLSRLKMAWWVLWGKY